MANISQNVNIEMLEKLPDGTYKRKYPKTQVLQVVGLDFATKAEAQAGTSNTKYMTPLRVKEGIEFIGKPVIGSYIGSGASSRVISLGFQPSAVLVIPENGRLYDHPNYIRGGLALIGKPAKISYGDAVRITTTGFTVYYETDTKWGILSNIINESYRYVAFK